MPEQVGDSADVIDNTDASRFELRADGWLAEIAYRVRGDRLVLAHQRRSRCNRRGAGRLRRQDRSGVEVGRGIVKALIANLADFAALDPFFRIIEQAWMGWPGPATFSTSSPRTPTSTMW
jgi:hypothetical protein